MQLQGGVGSLNLDYEHYKQFSGFISQVSYLELQIPISDLSGVFWIMKWPFFSYKQSGGNKLEL